jgi:hypothetical protein
MAEEADGEEHDRNEQQNSADDDHVVDSVSVSRLGAAFALRLGERRRPS